MFMWLPRLADLRFVGALTPKARRRRYFDSRCSGTGCRAGLGAPAPRLGPARSRAALAPRRSSRGYRSRIAARAAHGTLVEGAAIVCRYHHIHWQFPGAVGLCLRRTTRDSIDTLSVQLEFGPS